MGFERWANLPPSEIRLQSFGHAAVSADGVLDIKLIGIDGEIKFQKTMTPEGGGDGGNVGNVGNGGDGGTAAVVALNIVVTAVMVMISLVV